MGLTDFLVHYNTLLIHSLGYGGIFILMALESMIFPIPSELVMPFAGFLIVTGHFDLPTVIVVSSLGSITGSLLSYGMGTLGEPVVLRYGRYMLLNRHHLEWTELFFFRHGGKTIFFSRFIPVVRHLISIPAGLARMSLIPFILYTAAGATLWNGFLTYLGMRLKENWWIIQRYTHIADYFVVAGLIGVVVYLGLKVKRARRAGLNSATAEVATTGDPQPRSQEHQAASPAIINPTREPWDKPVSERVILTFTLPDYRYLCRLLQVAESPRYIYNCEVREGVWDQQAITLMAPALGAPYAVMVLEKLIALGARMVLALGWCGSLQANLAIGDLLLPTAAVSTEGTSPHYPLNGQPVAPDPGLLKMLRGLMQNTEAAWQEGAVWSTDGFYRETAELVRCYQDQGVLGVDMEMAALFTLGRFRRVPVAGLLVVSDELATLAWQPGYRSEGFKKARDKAARLMLSAAAQWDEGHA
jgi:membrane protein DedA with SNARE-associated domain/uridine phosphorylase